MSLAVKNSTFGLNGPRACISGQKNKEKYMEYQNDYKKAYGVYPELDKINNPYTARWNDVYDMCCTLRKPGFYGALYFHDLHNRYRKKLKHIYENYSKEWSFLISIDLERRSTFYDIPNMPVSENIINDLGYRKDEDGNYYEGTWKNGKLIYGFVYLSEQNIFYAGSFDESGKTDCHGVSINLGKSDSKKREVITTVGNFRINNGILSLYNSICLVNIATIKNNELISVDSKIGKFKDGYAEGTFINKIIDDEIRIGWDKYKDGEIKSSMSSIEMLPRTIMMLYTFMWYMIKYIYGTAFLITPLYYAFRKKNWKI